MIMIRFKPTQKLLCALLLLGWFAQMASAVEIDVFDNSRCYVEIQRPDGGMEAVWMTGNSTMLALFAGPPGNTGDHDGDGLDDVNALLSDWTFAGVSPILGPLHMHLSTIKLSGGVMEEQANNTPGILDVPPFTAAGTVNSFFDVFLEMVVSGQKLHNGPSNRLSCIITHKPPVPGNIYQNILPTPLLDTGGNPTGFFLLTTQYIPNPAVEVDAFGNSKCQFTLTTPTGTDVIQMTGHSKMRVFFDGLVQGSADDDDGDGLDDVQTELTDWTFAGVSPILGPVQLRLSSIAPSLGAMEEQANNTPGTLDVQPFTVTGTVSSFFDVFMEVEVGGQILHTNSPIHLAGTIAHKPPGAGEVWQGMDQIELYDSDGNPTRNLAGPVIYEPNVPVCGDAQHPYPTGDLNHDCKVDFGDFAIFALHWLECAAPECD
jgi:hypothetical protein